MLATPVVLAALERALYAPAGETVLKSMIAKGLSGNGGRVNAIVADGGVCSCNTRNTVLENGCHDLYG